MRSRLSPSSLRYDGSIYGPQGWSDVAEVDAYLSEEALDQFGLPPQFVVRYAATEPFGIFPGETAAFDSTVSPLVWAGFGFISDLQDHVTITEGHFPNVTRLEVGEPVEAMIHEDLAVALGAQVGEDYVAYLRVRADDGFVRSVQIPVRFTGVWRSDRS